MKKIGRFAALMIGMIMILNVLPVTGVAAGEKANIGSEVVLTPNSTSAYVLFGKEITGRYMKYHDGRELGIADSNDPLWNEDFEMDGIEARKVYVPNYVYLSFDESFCDPSDSQYLVSLTYYDFGPLPGTIFVDYLDKYGNSKTVNVIKPGVKVGWRTDSFYIGDASFSGGMDYGASIRIRQGAYNAFKLIEVVNIDALKRQGLSAEKVAFPAVSQSMERALSAANLYSAAGSDGSHLELTDNFTRADAVLSILKTTGNEKAVADAEPSERFCDAEEKTAKALTVAEQLGLLSVPEDGRFRPDDKITVRELATFWLRYLKVRDSDIYGNAHILTEKYGLTLPQDLLVAYDRYAIRDNLVSTSYRALWQKRDGEEYPIAADLYERRIFSKEDIAAAGTKEFKSVEYMKPVKLAPKEINMAKAGRSVDYIDFFGEQMVLPYVTSQCINTESTKLIVGNPARSAMYEYNLEDKTIRYLDQCSVGSVLEAIVTKNDVIFYSKNGALWRMDWNSYESRRVADNAYSTLNVSDDGKWMSGYKFDSVLGEQVIPVYNIETGEEIQLEPGFEKIYPHSLGAGHPQINPVHTNLVSFCNECTTQGANNCRMWIADVNTKTWFNVFPQASALPNSIGATTGEDMTHELWSSDGEWLYACKGGWERPYIRGKYGVVRVDRHGKNKEYIGTGLAANHCFPSSDHNWVVADSVNNNPIALEVINTRTYESTMIAYMTPWQTGHPWHPHPRMSRDSRLITWQMGLSSDHVGVGIEDISDITLAEVKGGRIPYAENLNLVSYEKAVSHVTPGTYADAENCIIAAPGKTCYFDFNDDAEEKQDNSLTVEFTYYDEGYQPVNLLYTSVDKSEADRANILNASVSIKRNNTKKWITTVAEITDIDLSNRGDFRTDFAFRGGQDSKFAVRDVKVLNVKK